ncbi:hypothetical protein ARMGADRAFT_1038747 [Armillaria gallica]|uniref:Uncharacterized protein n=1 Tax=Armillaria gallica TaxID=47427 RepID=A0A2H3CGU6_ARMGA|nr:hypothetical protein ARMGADRAFT_1038747 [Armillaria gallica]
MRSRNDYEPAFSLKIVVRGRVSKITRAFFTQKAGVLVVIRRYLYYECTLTISATSTRVDGENILNEAEDEQCEEKRCYFHRLTSIQIPIPTPIRQLQRRRQNQVESYYSSRGRVRQHVKRYGLGSGVIITSRTLDCRDRGQENSAFDICVHAFICIHGILITSFPGDIFMTYYDSRMKGNHLERL